MTSAKGPGLYEFLIESELQQYYNGIKNDLKIQNVAQLKYVAEEDLHQIGMSKPEMRRLKKFFQRHYPQNYIHKFKKLLLTRKEEPAGLEPAPPERPREGASSRLPNKHMIPVESILVNKQLGQGEFGIVQQGVWTNDGDRIQVAIKCLSRDRMHNNPIEFLKEAAILHAIDHEHIVRLYGCVLDSAALMLVTELAPLRSLLECLKEPGLRASFPVLSLCDFAIQVCDGMQYLEAKRLIHRDLAARNILVFSKHQVKISDFGLSRALGVGKDYYQTNFNVNLKLPIAWCAPECISYLRFTSASDVWAYGVTLWEMFSYGFQPWAALTGHQILEAIDTPNHQRLEQPECCPKEYFSLMLRCWQHDPNKRPRFADLAVLLPECKPEQVKAVQEPSPELKARDQLAYRAGDVITVLDKGNALGCWKGALVNGKTGLFSPNNTVTYLGDDLPSSKPAAEPFKRGDSKHSSYASCRRLRADMISSPQGEVKHTGHVGLDGAYFGDVGFMGKSQHALPHLAVAPYKPAADCGDGGSGSSGDPAHSLLSRTRSDTSDRQPLLKLPGNGAAASAAAVGQPARTLDAQHEYHEITDEESPHSEKSFDFGPSLLAEMDAVFAQLGGGVGGGDVGPPPPTPPDPEAANTRNELRELAARSGTGKKKHATVKPISAHDQRTLDSAIAMATELAARSMGDGGVAEPPSPRSPRSPPPGRRKFSFRFPPAGSGGGGGGGGVGGNGEKRSFSDEAERIADVQSCISESARQVYSSLVEQGEGSPPPDSDSPLRLLRTFPAVRPRVRGNKHRAADDDNPIPLPPRDRTRPLPPSRPRHQRKHPLLLLPADPTKSRQDDSFEQRIAIELAALDEMPPDDDTAADDTAAAEEAEPVDPPPDTPPAADEGRGSEPEGRDPEAGGPGSESGTLHKHGDHVSCEDLLEFACDAPNAARTRGPLRGLLSDEARVMRTVLGVEVAGSACVEALDVCAWDVHRAIKLERLRALLRGERPLSTCHRALDACAWDITAAALMVQAESQ